MASILVRLVDISHGYMKDGRFLKILDGVTLELFQSQTYAVVGPSGTGKSTLLNLVGLLDTPKYGEYWFNGENLANATEAEVARIRNFHIGFVFQSFNLLPRLTAAENVSLPLFYRGCSRQESATLSHEFLTKVGLANKAHSYPAELSGGQRQRVAIARALVGKPSLILADEPTGNLDDSSAEEVLRLLLHLNRQEGTTLVVVTHDMCIAERMDSRILVQQGSICCIKNDKENTR